MSLTLALVVSPASVAAVVGHTHTHTAPRRSFLLEETRRNDSPTCCDWVDAGVMAVVGFTPEESFCLSGMVVVTSVFLKD